MAAPLHDERVSRARLSLEGLSVGDAFGDRFFVNPSMVDQLIHERALPRPPWPYTDDTEMALGIVFELERAGAISQNSLARRFVSLYDPSRGYGPAIHRVLRGIADGSDWRALASSQFGGQGSYGNGGAMRVGPLGAYFADDLRVTAAQAELSAEVTHTHPDAIAGAIAVAIAAAIASRASDDGSVATPREFLDEVGSHTPDSDVRQRLRRARDLPHGATVRLAVASLGNGSLVSAQDTVPFALWCAAQHLDNYEEAMWLAVSGLGDRDTTCAIAGSVVALSAGWDSIPATWRASREPLPIGELARPRVGD